jgi:1-acyl-sn-glycerol-3-phosphate acyltransferase
MTGVTARGARHSKQPVRVRVDPRLGAEQQRVARNRVPHHVLAAVAVRAPDLSLMLVNQVRAAPAKITSRCPVCDPPRLVSRSNGRAIRQRDRSSVGGLTMPSIPDIASPPPARVAVAPALLLQIVAELAREVRAGSESAPQVELDSNLERDLGFDSLERSELLLRVERAFGVRLPARTLVSAETPRDLLRAAQAGGAPTPPRPAAIAAPLADRDVGIPVHAATLLDALEWHAREHPERTHVTLLAEADAGPTAQPLTYGELVAEASRVAGGLLSCGLEPGQSCAIMLPTSRDFFVAFFGILQAGGVPVPIYPPARRSQLEEHLRRQSGIIGNALTAILVTTPSARAVARLLRAAAPSLKHIVSVAEFGTLAPSVPRWRPGAADIALLQYTSGSTGSPKGVILTHANLLANIRAMGRAVAVAPTDVFVSWLPLYHDMGLIGAWLGSLYYAIPLVVMSPTDFLGRPESWLWALHRFRATLSAGPNFAYEICATRLDESRLAGLDLSRLRIAFNGAEPVHPETITRFAERFAAFGFDARAQTPVYGLAESAVGLAFPPLNRGPLIDRVDRELLAQTGVATPAAAGDPRALPVVACGQPLPGHEIRIVDATGRELPERHEGRIEFRGPSATSGYFRNPEATRGLFHGDWLDTGDLGYIAGGDLYLTGRAKDIIIRGGQHIHPQETEAAVGNIRGIRKGCVTVFGVPDRASGTEQVVILAETRETDPARRQALRAAVAESALALLGAPPDDIVLAPPHTVLKTSSGKIRRAACRDLYQRGMTGAAPRAVWLQVARLAATSAAVRVRQTITRLGESLFAAYAWGLFAVMALTALALVALLPRLSWRRHAVTTLARAFVSASGIPVRLDGASHLQATGPVTVVANHASYLDGIVLLSVLPERCNFVAKRELTRNFATRLLLRGIGTRFVERFDVEASVAAAQDVATLAARGESFVFFPEGTFRREPGLLPFHMGAFIAAATAGTPVIPLAIRGTRSVLRDGQWLPHRGIVQVVVAAPLPAAGRDWPAAIRLRDDARAAILAACGEPDLAR